MPKTRVLIFNIVRLIGSLQDSWVLKHVKTLALLKAPVKYWNHGSAKSNEGRPWPCWRWHGNCCLGRFLCACAVLCFPSTVTYPTECQRCNLWFPASGSGLRLVLAVFVCSCFVVSDLVLCAPHAASCISRAWHSWGLFVLVLWVGVGLVICRHWIWDSGYGSSGMWLLGLSPSFVSLDRFVVEVSSPDSSDMHWQNHFRFAVVDSYSAVVSHTVGPSVAHVTWVSLCTCCFCVVTCCAVPIRLQHLQLHINVRVEIGIFQ